MDEYLIPTREAEAEFTEKRSRFIGHIWHVETEDEALACLQKVRELHWDARHNVYAYIIKDGPTRFSDAGEPGGTAGMPTLQVLQREGLFDVCCVTTRYFGGILLGGGGLFRAYGHAAKIAVDAAGKSMKRVWDVIWLPVPYNWYERMKQEVIAFEGIIRDTQYGADVELEVLTPTGRTREFLDRVVDISAGTLEGMITGQEYRAFPVETQ